MLEESSKEQPPSEDPRVRFAAERTLLAWVRTGLALMGFGFVVARFGLFLRELEEANKSPSRHSTGTSLWIGVALVTLGAVVTFLAAGQHLKVIRRLDHGRPYVPPTWSLGVIVAFILTGVGAGMIVYLLTLQH